MYVEAGGRYDVPVGFGFQVFAHDKIDQNDHGFLISNTFGSNSCAGPLFTPIRFSGKVIAVVVISAQASHFVLNNLQCDVRHDCTRKIFSCLALFRINPASSDHGQTFCAPLNQPHLLVVNQATQLKYHKQHPKPKMISITSTIYALLFLTLFGLDSVSASTINFGGGSCSNCNDPGHFCGVDGTCHAFSCQNYYQYAHRALTGYADDATFQCFGYSQGDIENAHGVIYGCDPLFPMTLMTPGKQVTEPFNRKCTAEREGGYLFECYEFQPSETATNFDFFEREAESSFPDCEDGKQPKYYYIIASSNHYTGFEGLQGNPIVEGGADRDGDTLWQTNEGNFFKRELAMYSMYANVVGGPGPSTYTSTIQAGPLGGNNPLKNPKEGAHGGYADSGALSQSVVASSLILLGFGMLFQVL